MQEPRDFNDPKYKAWRKGVYARDKYKCQMPGCAGADKTLNAHHIKTWAAAPQLRYVKSNGVTLCRTCHDSIRGREGDYESVFLRIVNKDTGEILLRMMMARYADVDQQPKSD